MIVNAGGGDVGVAEPFLDLGDVSALVESVRRGRRPGCVRTEALRADADLPPVVLDDLIHAVRRQGRVGRPTAVVPDRLEEGRGAEGVLGSR